MSKDPSQTIEEFISTFARRDASLLSPYLHEEIEFESYGDAPIIGRAAVLALWEGVFSSMAEVSFTTIQQAENGEIVLAEQVHGLALPGRAMAPVRNMASYRVVDGLIVQWRDYSNPEYGRTLL